MPDLAYDLQNGSNAPLQPKALYAGDVFQGQPSLVVTKDEIVLAGDENNVINVNPVFGVMLAGKLSLSAMPDQISIGGGYWRFNPLLISCLPSTTPTPVPVLVKSTPELFQASGAISGALAFLKQNSDIPN